MQPEYPPDSELEHRPQRISRRLELLRLAMRGYSAKQAAESLEIPYSAALQEYRDREFRALAFGRLEHAFAEIDGNFEEEKKSLHERLAEKSNDAFRVLCELLEDEEVHPGVRVKIAQDMLDRNPDTMAGSVVRHEKFDPQQLMRAAQAASEMDNVIQLKRKPA
jgi:hypothetical protein